MWKVLFLLACMASFEVVFSGDDDSPIQEKPDCGCDVPPPKCGRNEVYNNCSVPICRPRLCSELGYPLKCDKKCKPGCVCKGDCVRNDKGVCIPVKDCPSCGGDKNAESGCGNNCGKTCATYKMKNPICHPCKVNGCDCRDGFVYDPVVKACVRPKDCKPVCPAGEVWDKCPTVPCEGDYCPKTRDSPQTCPVGIVCDKPRCVCAYNRKRDRKTGKCIPITDCPPFKCGCNEEYRACPPDCPGEKCSDYRKKPTCPKTDIILKCRPQCRCIKGYYRNADGKCIPACECPDC